MSIQQLFNASLGSVAHIATSAQAYRLAQEAEAEKAAKAAEKAAKAAKKKASTTPAETQPPVEEQTAEAKKKAVRDPKALQGATWRPSQNYEEKAALAAQSLQNKTMLATEQREALDARKEMLKAASELKSKNLISGRVLRQLEHAAKIAEEADENG